jgi:hypothetical protein
MRSVSDTSSCSLKNMCKSIEIYILTVRNKKGHGQYLDLKKCLCISSVTCRLHDFLLLFNVRLNQK